MRSSPTTAIIIIIILTCCVVGCWRYWGTPATHTLRHTTTNRTSRIHHQRIVLRRLTQMTHEFVRYLEMVQDPLMLRLLNTMHNKRPVLRHTAERAGFTDNKGDVVAICLNDVTEENVQDDQYINELFYVVLHELAHMSTSSWGHGSEFWNAFELVRRHASDAGLLHPLRSSTSAVCGERLTTGTQS